MCTWRYAPAMLDIYPHRLVRLTEQTTEAFHLMGDEVHSGQYQIANAAASVADVWPLPSPIARRAQGGSA